MSMSLTSSAFSNQGAIPTTYTCEGPEISPALSWKDVPSDAKSLVLIVSDPDAPDPKAPKMTWMHWVLYNMPPQTTGLAEDVQDKLPAGTLIGMNSEHKARYQGPCPPIGVHRYYFRLYALSTTLPDMQHPTAEAVLAAIQGKVIAEAELMGTYVKAR